MSDALGSVAVLPSRAASPARLAYADEWLASWRGRAAAEAGFAADWLEVAGRFRAGVPARGDRLRGWTLQQARDCLAAARRARRLAPRLPG